MTKKQRGNNNPLEQFMELWQQQFETMVKNPEIAASMMELFEKAGKEYLKAAEIITEKQASANTENEEIDEKFFTNASLSKPVVAEFNRLYMRIARLEERVAKLESQNTKNAGTKGKTKG